MKLSNLLVINAIVALVYGISFVLVPATVLSLYGMTQGPSAALAGQFFGVALIAIGLLTWFTRNITDSDTQRAFILALLISDVIGVIVAVLGTVSGVMSAVGWSAVGIYLLLSLGFAYFQFMKPSAS
jgi:NAD/NADP transhydrogenase beta subunit